MASSLPSGPVFISSHSADVILSDIRPVKLAQDALGSLNAVLDEVLTTVVLTARSLATDRLKAALLRILTTPLGKEALLEAELELRAYWERTKATAPSAGDSDRLNVQWAAELLRLKCVAYSTLNDTDEDGQAERRLAERMGNGDLGCSSALVAPAALYMTAILECLCEHILSNVGRVATRDSSRTVATVTDLFTALCEDDAMYALFKSLHIYDHISLLSRAPKHRQNKSISGQKPSDAASPTNQEQLHLPSRKDSHHRKSSESAASGPSAFTPGHAQSGVSRSSLEKVRGIKLFNKAHGRTSSERDVQSGPDVYATPRRSESGGYDHAGAAGMQSQSLSGHSDAHNSAASVEDERDQEFEDLVRSAGTMKMSLTPDRLRTMESHRMRNSPGTSSALGNGTQRPADIGATPTRVNIAPAPSPAPPVQRSTSIRHKLSQHSFKDSDASRNLSASVTVTSPSSMRKKSPIMSTANGNARARSISTSGAYPSKSGPPPALPQSSTSTAPTHLRSQTGPPPRSQTIDEFGMPKKTRKIQRNRESMDLDDIMNGSDEDVAEVPKTPSRSVRSPGSAKPSGTGGHISQSARDLIAFLEDGPPVDPYSRPPVDLPPIETVASPKSGKGRLQRMISKLSLSAERERESQQSPQRGNANGYASMPSTPAAHYTPPLPVPVMPKPPRYSPAPTSLISPPDSPTEGVEGAPIGSEGARKTIRKAVPVWNPSLTNLSSTPPSTVASSQQTSRQPSPSVTPSATPNSAAGSWIQPTPLKVVNGQLERLPAHKAERKGDNLAGANHAPSVSPASPVSPPPRPERADRIASPPDVVLQSAPRRPSASRGGRPDSANSEKRARRQQTILPPDHSALSAPTLSENFAIDMRRMLARATSADECRLLVDMFMARAGFGMSPSDAASVAAAAPPINPERASQAVAPPGLERELIELFLGEGSRTANPNTVAYDSGARAYQTPRQSREAA
ncbi:unnamed protein product [Peniophora sp. CBMAI 1063]|nr:unnamed protein product [Peniophora sp. CBMAI 1063]